MSETHRTYLALLVAVLDGACDTRIPDLLDDPDLARQVAAYAAHKMVASVDAEDRGEMRADIAAELLAIAGDDG